MGARHLRVLRAMPGVDAFALPARRGRRAGLARLGFRVVADLAAARATGVRAAIVATNTGLHLAHASAALKAGLAVLVEKPLAVDAARGRRLRAAGAAFGRPVFVGQVLRFSESLQRARREISRLGGVHSVRIECQSYLPDWRPGRPYRSSYSARPAEGGVLRDMIHEVDYAGWLFGWPGSVSARVGRTGRLGIRAEDSADLFWRSPRGAVVSMRLDYVTRPPRRRLVVCGRKGTVEWDGIAQTVEVHPAAGPRRRWRSRQTRNQMLAAADGAFLARAVGGKRSPFLADADEAVRALAVCDAARRASRAGSPATVDYR